MEFLTLLIVLGLVQLWGSGGPLQRDEWFYEWIERVNAVLAGGKFRLLAIVAVPVILVLLLQSVLDSVLFGLLSLVLFVGVLSFSLGRGDFNEVVQNYLASWQQGNFESAYEKALSIGDFQQSEAISGYVSLHERVRAAILYAGYQRWFAVVFWFLLLGPCGALGYRLSFMVARSELLTAEDRQLAHRFVHYLDWIPCRLQVLSFAVVGNFVNVLNACWQKLMDNLPAPELLEGCAVAAISGDGEVQVPSADEQRFVEYGDREIRALQNLLSRALICWLVVIAILTVATA